MSAKINNVSVDGLSIGVKTINSDDYISLTDLAKYREATYPSETIHNWMRSRSTVEFLGLWESLYNPNFNSIGFDRIDSEAGKNGFILTPTRWIESVNAIGMISKQGRYAEALAHKDIAFKFASWISTKFELYLIKEFQRLKIEEQKHLEWNAKRELSKLNYHIHTDAIREKLILPTLTQAQKSYVYADEADLLNVALFGKMAREWRKENPEAKGNIRDAATLHELIVLANMESHNAAYIAEGLVQEERLVRLRGIAERELRVLQQTANSSFLLETGKNIK